MAGIKKLIGFLLIAFSILGLAVNFVVLFPLFRLARRPGNSSTHVIALVTVINDLISSFLNTFYLAPTIILNNPIFSDSIDGPIPTFLSQILMMSWYMQNFQMILMALNRLFAITLRKPLFFSKPRIFTFLMFSVVYSIVKTCLNVWVIPCCLVLFDHENYGYTFQNSDFYPNYADISDYPLFATCFFVTIVCYITVNPLCPETPNVLFQVFCTIHKSNKTIQHCVTSRQYRNLRAHEVSYAFQFGAVSLFGMLCFASFRIFHELLKDQCTLCFAVIPFFHTISISVNALIYLCWNWEVQSNLQV